MISVYLATNTILSKMASLGTRPSNVTLGIAGAFDPAASRLFLRVAPNKGQWLAVSPTVAVVTTSIFLRGLGVGGRELGRRTSLKTKKNQI
jgi:hypothetical protein